MLDQIDNTLYSLSEDITTNEYVSIYNTVLKDESGFTKRLFAKCYWLFLKEMLEHNYRINQRQLSRLLTNDPERKIKEDPNYIAKLIKRNTFPSYTVSSKIAYILNWNSALDGIYILRYFINMDKTHRHELFQSFAKDELNRSSETLKLIEDKIRLYTEEQLKLVLDFLMKMESCAVEKYRFNGAGLEYDKKLNTIVNKCISNPNKMNALYMLIEEPETK